MSTGGSTGAVVWLRQDLRLRDNPALHAAAKLGGPIVPVYNLCDAEEREFPPGGASRWWLHRSLAALDLNQDSRAPELTLNTTAVGAQVSCTNPRGSGLNIIAYSRVDGPYGRDSVWFEGNSSGQLDLARNQFPAGITYDNVRVDCTTFEGMTSGLAIPPSDLPGEGCPYRVGTFIVTAGSAVGVLLPRPVAQRTETAVPPDISAPGLVPDQTYPEGVEGQLFAKLRIDPTIPVQHSPVANAPRSVAQPGACEVEVLCVDLDRAPPMARLLEMVVAPHRDGTFQQLGQHPCPIKQ